MIWKCISIRHPWNWAILSAGKRVENRTWSTKYRGPILLHAAKGMSNGEYADFQLFYEHQMPRRPLQSYAKLPAKGALDRGGVVGKAVLIDVIMQKDAVPSGKDNLWAEQFVAPWFFGPYGFVLDEVQPVPFVQHTGELGLFDVTGRVLQEKVS